MLEQLRDALDVLPTGAALEGLATPGVRIQALDISSEAEFAGQPAAPTPATDLPRTGGGLAPIALLLLALGSTGAVAVKRARG